jgi:hypothetical protein
MKRALFGVLLGLLVFMTVVFVLNRRHGSPDVYYGGSLTPVHPDLSADPMIFQLIPSEVTHVCPTCGTCTHPVEIVECPRTLSIRDHRRWYQFFHWSDRTYYFDDLVQFAGSYRNSSARDPVGRWTIGARIGPARHEGTRPHDCGDLPSGLGVTYELVATESLPEGQPRPLGPSITLQDQVQALAFRYQFPTRSTVLHFAWRIAPGTPPGVSPAAPCACGKP